ncbi:uncharacterized protein JCM6883_006790 [Sporobolomyces salmoneus]|uniref:uncharacterized protein n=1 Tax=Sporobolomyces salmoneus TaxID=183962 RepID=UPI00317DAEE5
MIAEHFNPPIPFELGHFTLPSRYTRLGRQELRSLAMTCRKFARLFRPFVTRTLTFQDRGRRTNTVHLFNAEKETKESVQEVYWEVSHCYNDASPLFLPNLKNLTYLILAFLPQRIPDDELNDYSDVCTLRKSFTDALKSLPNLKALEIPFWEQAEDKEFSFTKDIPKLTDIAIGDWGEYGAFEGGGKITDVKFLVHPDLDLEEELLEGFVKTLMPHAKRLQFAAYSGWGRTDLPEKLASTIRNSHWYDDMKKHPLETLTVHGFNPLTSYKEEWTTIMPEVLSLLQGPKFKTITFLDVPSMRNDDRHPLNWDNTSPLLYIEDVSIILAVQELEGELAEQVPGDGERRNAQPVSSSSQREEGNGGDQEINEDDYDALSERLTAEELQSLLHLFPNLRRLTLGNFHRCGNKASTSSFDSDFAENEFQPAARDFISRLGIETRYTKLQQIIFRNAEAGLAVRFKRPSSEEGAAVEDWNEELRRLY